MDLASNKSMPLSTNMGREYVEYCRRRLLKEYLPRIQHCLNELSDEDIWWRAHETNNSTGNLILHLSGNVQQWIVHGLGGAPDNRNRPQEFAERQQISKRELLKRLEEVLHRADEVLQRFDTNQLLSTRHIQKYDVTCLDALSHVVEHFAQHLGQIIYITKLRTGKDLRFYDL